MSTGTEVEVRQAASLPAKVEYARMLAASGLLPAAYRDRPANILYAIEYGDMLGLSPMAAITGVHVIEGKPSASAGLISALVRRAGHKLRVFGDAKSATCQITRADDPDYTFTVTFTMEDARTAGLTGKDVWKKYGQSMLKSRAITQCARDACEEALFGLHYTPEELGAEVDADGEVIAGEIVQEPAPARQAAKQRATPDDDPFYVRPAPEGGWLAGALELAPALASLDACNVMWRKSVEMVQAGTLTRPDAGHLQAVLRTRIWQLKDESGETAETAEAQGQETGAGGAVTLDPADPWAAKIEELAASEDRDAALVELTAQLGEGEIDGERFRQVEAAILARFPQDDSEGRAAA